MEFIKKIYYSIFDFHLKINEKLNFYSFAGSALRGGFGYSFKNIVCLQKDKKDCKDCILLSNCPYYIIFEAKNLSKDFKKMEEFPKPYVIEPGEFEKGQANFKLILIGKAINYFPYFFLSFSELGKKGIGKGRKKYQIMKVQEIYPMEKEIYKLEDEKINLPEIIKFNELKLKEIKRLKIKFTTPLKIKKNGKFVETLNFDILIESILRRIYFLLNFWCDSKVDYNFKDLIKKAKNIGIEKEDFIWVDYERYSTRQKRKLKLGGIMGEIIYSGDITPFYTLLELGSQIHIGKNTTFGFGKYQIENERS